MVIKGRAQTETHRRNLSNSLKGRVFSEEWRKKISISRSGKMCGEQHPFFGKTRSDEVKRAISEKNKGKKRSAELCKRMSEYRKGRPVHTIESRKKISEAHKGKIVSIESRKRMSEAQRKMCAKSERHHTEETKKKIGDANKGERSYLWKGGISFEPYCPKFTREFKERVRAFFNYQCVECGIPQNRYKLHVHHVNFNKKSCCDSTTPLFVSLCKSCHAKTNFKREFWREHFMELINKKHGGQCYVPLKTFSNNGLETVS